MNKAEKFKSKGESILRDQRPDSMEDFLNDTPDGFKIDTKTHKSTLPEIHKSTDGYKSVLGRLHIQIRQDLVDWLIDEVFRRKREGCLSSL